MVTSGPMNTSGLIAELSKSKLIAECPCGEQFALSDALLFDGLGKAPSKAEGLRLALLSALKERQDALKKQKLSAQEGAEQKAIEVGIGKIVEKIIPNLRRLFHPHHGLPPAFRANRHDCIQRPVRREHRINHLPGNQDRKGAPEHAPADGQGRNRRPPSGLQGDLDGLLPP